VVEGSREVAVAEDAVAVDRVAVSSVLEEVFDPGGDIDCCCPRPIWVIEGVVKDRGSVEEVLRSPRDEKPEEAGPTVCDEKRSCLDAGLSATLAGIASSDVGGTPRYGSA
jgi:hypothetical protein